MKEKLVDYLSCIECQGALQCTVQEADPSLPWPEVLEGYLTCIACSQKYAIHKGVPRMMGGEIAPEVQKTVEGFGWEWQTFNDDIQDTYMTDKVHFLDFIHPTAEDFFVDKLVLDAGCGMGRFLRLGAEFGSREIIGIDLSQSVEVAYQNTRKLPNAHVVQADILALPFAIKFDYIFSIGVLQFMPDPEAGFVALTHLLNPGGRISAWVYSEENNGWVTRLITPFRKHITSHLPKPVLYFLCRCLGIPLYGMLKLLYKPANEGKFGFKFGHCLPYNEYFYYTSRLTYGSLVSVIFDHLVPQIVIYLSKMAFTEWFQRANLTQIIITGRNNMSWRGQGDCLALDEMEAMLAEQTTINA